MLANSWFPLSFGFPLTAITYVIVMYCISGWVQGTQGGHWTFDENEIKTPKSLLLSSSGTRLKYQLDSKLKWSNYCCYFTLLYEILILLTISALCNSSPFRAHHRENLRWLGIKGMNLWSLWRRTIWTSIRNTIWTSIRFCRRLLQILYRIVKDAS